MKVIYGRNNSPLSWLIRLFTWSRWSHCGIIDSTGKNVIEATAKRGVIVTPLDQFKKRYTRYAVGTLPVRDGIDPQTLARQQIGKPYDWWAVVAIVLRQDWDQDDAWFCSELIAHCTGLYRTDRNGRVTPEHIWMITS